MHLKASSSVGRRTSRARPITVHFPIPKKAISTLRALAIGKDPRLVDLGVLAVQISDDESIVLGIELEKAKRRDLAIPNNVSATSSNAYNTNSPRTVVGFGSAARNLGSSSTAAFYANHCVTTTARNEVTLSSKTKRSLTTAAKKKAKETLNAARRGGARAKPKGKAGKGGQLSAAAVRASTWEMVYSHIGLPGAGYHRHNQTNPPYIEPTVASLASGIANVPVAQPGLPRENTPKSESRKREASASSPPHKSPGNSALYSEDDSSVSSSPCSHSPMNEEELLNLFVDSNFSATSILKQLAESRVKEDVKNSDELENGGKQIDPNHWSNWNPETSTTTSLHDDKSRTYSPVNRVKAQVSSSTISSRGGLNHFNFSPPSATCTSTTPSGTSSNALMKRPSSLLSFSGESLSNLYGSPGKRQRRSFAELEIKREMVDLSSKVFEKELQKVAEGLSTESSNQPSQQSLAALSPTTANQSSTSTKSQSTALRNYSQYGYYYSAEDLKALGSKALSSKALSKAVPASSKTNKGESLCAFANTGIDVKPTMSSNQHSQVASDSKLMHPNDSSSPLSTDAVNQGSNTPPLQSCSFKDQRGSIGGSNNSNVKTGVSKNSGSVDDCVSSTDDSVIVAVTSSQPNSSAADRKSLTIIAPTTSSPALSTSSDTKQPDNTSSDANSGLRKSGQCYALSYVYPMGTVWYPYVAITPYAVLGNAEKDGIEIINDDKDQENATKGLSSYSSAQYIDLASSLRYWQQLSLLYKNKLLSSTSCLPNMPTDSNKVVSESANSPSPSHTEMSSLTCSSASSSNKPTRRASVIVAAKGSETYDKEYNKGVLSTGRDSTSTPESTDSTESVGSEDTKAEVPLVIDNCNRLIEEHCHRMSEVFAETSQDTAGCSITKNTDDDVPNVPSLSFIPDSSIAYVNIGNNNGQGSQGTKKSGGNGKDSKGKTKRRKSNKSV